MTPRRALVPGLALAFLLALLPAAAGAQQPSPQMTLEEPLAEPSRRFFTGGGIGATLEEEIGGGV